MKLKSVSKNYTFFQTFIHLILEKKLANFALFSSGITQKPHKSDVLSISVCLYVSMSRKITNKARPSVTQNI